VSILRKATQETKTISLDETDYIVVLADISKREFNALVASMPASAKSEEGITMADATTFQRALFEMLVVGWSLSDGKPTVADYNELAAESANAVDAKLADHFSSLLPSSAEGK
jgi:hypothetical protein